MTLICHIAVRLGALRDGDDELGRSDLGRLIGALLAMKPGDGQ